MSRVRTQEVLFRLFIPGLTILFLALAGCSSQEAVKAPPGPTPEQKKIDSLITENVNLGQKLIKVQQDNNTLNSRLSDVEAKLKAELDRAAAAAKPPPPPPAPTATYEGAQKAFSEKKYDDAIQMFQALLSGGIPEDLADNCHYWMGESYFGKKDYQSALKEFDAVLQYKVSEKKGDAYFMMGRTYVMLGDKAKAKEAFEKVVKDYPTNNNVAKAKEHWGKL